MNGRPIVWRSLAARLALAALPTWFTITVLVFATPWQVKLLIASVFTWTLISPAGGFLAALAIAPLGQLIAALKGPAFFRIGEAVVLAFIAGWLLRSQPDRQGPRVAGVVGWLLALTVAVSVGAQAWQLEHFAAEPHDTLRLLYQAYYLLPDRIGFADGARLLEGLAIAVAAVALFRQRPRMAIALPSVIAASATLAAAASVLLSRGIAPEPILRRHMLLGDRVSAHVADVNAAGSYFAMALCLALGMAARGRGRGRAAWLAGSTASWMGLWLSDSRSAFGALALALAAAAVWFAGARWPNRRRTLAVCTVILVVGVAAWAQLQRVTTRAEQHGGTRFRLEFNLTSLRMIRARPWLGVGIGQYQRMSPLFMGPELAWNYGGENAHNYFLQVAAELGVVGFSLFVLWLGAGLLRMLRALTIAPRDARLLGIAAGLATFLGTSLTGHPLLITEVAMPFWAVFGIGVGLGGATLLTGVNAEDGRPSPRVWSVTGWIAAAGVLLLVVVPKRDLRPAQDPAIDGFFGWETGADGERYRWTGEYASVFVPADVTRVYLPVRMPIRVAGLWPMGVEVRTDARKQPSTAVGASWTILNIELPEVLPPVQFNRVNIKVDRTWQPALYVAGSADLRSVGVQVGESRLFRER
jgi:O-antigen ligase